MGESLKRQRNEELEVHALTNQNAEIGRREFAQRHAAQPMTLQDEMRLPLGLAPDLAVELLKGFRHIWKLERHCSFKGGA